MRKTPSRHSKEHRNKNILDRWLDKLRSDGTRRTYRAGIRKFMELVYKKDLTDREELARVMDQYIQEVKMGTRNAGEDILLLTGSSLDLSPKGARAYISGVKDFFEESDIVLNGRESKVLRRNQPTTEALTDGRAPTKGELIKVLSHCDLRMKALILFISATGVRLGEALSVDLQDVKMDEHPIRVCIKAVNTKTQRKRETFLTDEAASVLREWLTVRERYLETSRKRHISKLYGKKVDNRLFPYSDGFISRQWQSVAGKAGIYEVDPSTGHGTITIHSLRKYTKVQLLKDGNGEFGEFLLGHTGVNQIYNKMALEEKANTYLDHQAALMTSVDAERYQKQVVSVAEKMQETDRQVRDVLLARAAMEDRLLVMQKENDLLKERIAELEKYAVMTKSLFDNPEIMLESLQKKVNASK